MAAEGAPRSPLLPTAPPSSPDLEAQVPALADKDATRAALPPSPPDSLDLEAQLYAHELPGVHGARPQSSHDGLPGNVLSIESSTHRTNFGQRYSAPPAFLYRPSIDSSETPSIDADDVPVESPAVIPGAAVLERTRSILSWTSEHPAPVLPIQQNIYLAGLPETIELVQLPSRRIRPARVRANTGFASRASSNSGPGFASRVSSNTGPGFASRSSSNSGPSYGPRLSPSHGRANTMRSSSGPSHPPPSALRGHEAPRRIIKLDDPNPPAERPGNRRLMDLEDRDETVAPNCVVRLYRWVDNNLPYAKQCVAAKFWCLQHFLSPLGPGLKMVAICLTLLVSSVLLTILVLMVMDMWFQMLPDGWAVFVCGLECVPDLLE